MYSYLYWKIDRDRDGKGKKKEEDNDASLFVVSLPQSRNPASQSFPAIPHSRLDRCSFGSTPPPLIPMYGGGGRGTEGRKPSLVKSERYGARRV